MTIARVSGSIMADRSGGWRLGAGAAETRRAPDAPRLGIDEAAHQRLAGGRHVETALAPVGIAGRLDDKAALDELAQHAGEALLGDVEDQQDVGDRRPG